MFVTGRFKELFAGHRRVMRLMAVSMLKLVRSPLELRYYSQVPYALGDRACKFALIPAEKPGFCQLPNGFDRHYLRHAAERTLRRRAVRYHFCLQLGQDPASESLEDSTVAWAGPYIPVADLTFLTIDQPMQLETAVSRSAA